MSNDFKLTFLDISSTKPQSFSRGTYLEATEPKFSTCIFNGCACWQICLFSQVSCLGSGGHTRSVYRVIQREQSLVCHPNKLLYRGRLEMTMRSRYPNRRCLVKKHIDHTLRDILANMSCRQSGCRIQNARKKCWVQVLTLSTRPSRSCLSLWIEDFYSMVSKNLIPPYNLETMHHWEQLIQAIFFLRRFQA